MSVAHDEHAVQRSVTSAVDVALERLNARCVEAGGRGRRGAPLRGGEVGLPGISERRGLRVGCCCRTARAERRENEKDSAHGSSMHAGASTARTTDERGLFKICNATPTAVL